jgi:hypothetical protein
MTRHPLGFASSLFSLKLFCPPPRFQQAHASSDECQHS